MSDTPPGEATTSSDSWQTLDELLQTLSNEAETLNEDSLRLKTLLGKAQDELIALSSRLELSQTVALGLSRSLEQSGSSLQTLADSLRSEQRRQRIELWVWRGGVAVSTAIAILALLQYP